MWPWSESKHQHWPRRACEGGWEGECEAAKKQSGPREGVRKLCISAAIYHLREKRMVCLCCKKTLPKCNLNNTRPFQHNEELCKEVEAAASPPPTNKQIKAGAGADDTQLEFPYCARAQRAGWAFWRLVASFQSILLSKAKRDFKKRQWSRESRSKNGILLQIPPSICRQIKTAAKSVSL